MLCRRHLLVSLCCLPAIDCATQDADRVPQLGSGVAATRTAGELGIDLMLPFEAGASRLLTRGYQSAPTHLDHSPGEQSGIWDDRFALDFAGPGCESWNQPVVAPVAGVVRIDDRPNVTASYGNQHVIIDVDGVDCFVHLAHLESRIVSAGQRVEQGEVVGFEGNRGNHSGTQCPTHPGSHVHLKLVCDGGAVKPEPISGYRSLDSSVSTVFTHRALHHPIGTLVQVAAQPEIYTVCADDELCHVSDEAVFRAHRLWQDSNDEWATVVRITAAERDCHQVGPPLDRPVTLHATRCVHGLSLATFVTFDDGDQPWRRRVPFDVADPLYRILLRSWGFAVSEVVSHHATCAIPVDAGDDRLYLRAGTVIEMASDDDFYVVQHDATAYRLVRNLTDVLYGEDWPEVIQVPDGTVPQLIRRIDPQHRRFTVADATTCPNGSVTLRPAPLGGGAGGGAASEQPERSIRCEHLGDRLRVSIRGPFALVGGTAPSGALLTFGSDTQGWSGCAGDGRAATAYLGDRDQHGATITYALELPLSPGRFNGELCTGGAPLWLDLPDADGDGAARDRWWLLHDLQRQLRAQYDGTPPPAPRPPPAPPVPPPAPPPSDAERSVRCEHLGDTLTITITGPISGGLVGGDVAEPTAILIGSDHYGWGGAFPMAWRGDRRPDGLPMVYTTTIPADLGLFNPFVSGSPLRWFDLPDADGNGVHWTVAGDCHVACSSTSCALSL